MKDGHPHSGGFHPRQPRAQAEITLKKNPSARDEVCGYSVTTLPRLSWRGLIWSSTMRSRLRACWINQSYSALSLIHI